MATGTPLRVPLEVRYRDTDSLGHVNNAVYLSYLENGRVAFFRELWDEAPQPWPFVLGRVEVDFLKEVRFGEALELELGVSRWGRSSFDFQYRGLRVPGEPGGGGGEEADGDEVVFQGRTVQVWLDPAGGSAPIPDEVREAVEALQGGGLVDLTDA